MYGYCHLLCGVGKNKTQECIELDCYKHFMRQEVIQKTIEIPIINRVVEFLNQVEVTENTDVKSIICYDLGGFLQPNIHIVELHSYLKVTDVPFCT